MDLRGLDKKLKRSFQVFRADTDNIKANISRLSDNVKSIKSAVENLKESSITKDKINVLKIKLGEVDDQLKKTWALEEEFKELETRTISKEFFNQQFDALNDEFDDLKASMVNLNKETVNELQIKELIDDLNDEFNKIRNSVEEIRSIKDTITQKELEKRTNKLNSKIDNFRAEYKKFEDKARSFSTRGQLDELGRDTSKAIDELKKMVNYNKQSLSRKVSEKRVQGFDNSIKELKKSLKEKVSENEIHNLVGDINKEFSGLKKDIEKSNSSIKAKADIKAFESTGKEIRMIRDFLKKKADKDAIKGIERQIGSINASLKQAIKKDDVKSFARENSRLKEEIAKFKEQVNKTLDEDAADLNDFFSREADKLKKRMSLLESKDIRELRKNSVTRKEFDGGKSEIQAQLKKINDRLGELDKIMVDKSSFEKGKKSIQEDIKNITQNIHQIRKGYAKESDIEKIKEYIERIERKSVRNGFFTQKEVKTAEVGKIAPKMVKVIKTKTVLDRKRAMNRKYACGNMLIGLAFVLLVTSIALFFANSYDWMNGTAITAIISFIVGIIVRVSVIKQRRKGVE